MIDDGFEKDRLQTLRNREHLKSNANLRFWYSELYDFMFEDEVNFGTLAVLEVGSGASPLKDQFPHVMTSDILKMDHIDHVFDCHDIDNFEPIEDRSLDIVTMTNVLHHLRDPLDFLKRASSKLKPGGHVLMTEPYFSALSYPVYKALHHEPVDFSVDRPMLGAIEGPLSTSNQAMPQMIFSPRRKWLRELEGHYDLQHTSTRYFTALAYPMTGGIERNLPISPTLYKIAFAIDKQMAQLFPRLFASFFVVRLEAR